jgi:hypothetical protein
MKLAGRSLTVFLAGAVAARALTVGAGPPIRLRPYTLRLNRDPEKVLAELRAQLEYAPNVLVRSGDSLVASFAGRAGALRYRTVELVRFSDRQVTFEHLSGPFRSAQESFDVVSLPDGSPALEHRGRFAMRYGLFGWIFGRLVIRRIFEGLVASHMAQLADAATSNPVSDQSPVDPV